MEKPLVEKTASSESPHPAEELIASFGETRLVRVHGRLQLHGGAMSDRLEALEWISMFLPGELINEKSPARK